MASTSDGAAAGDSTPPAVTITLRPFADRDRKLCTVLLADLRSFDALLGHAFAAAGKDASSTGASGAHVHLSSGRGADAGVCDAVDRFGRQQWEGREGRELNEEWKVMARERNERGKSGLDVRVYVCFGDEEVVRKSIEGVLPAGDGLVRDGLPGKKIKKGYRVEPFNPAEAGMQLAGIGREGMAKQRMRHQAAQGGLPSRGGFGRERIGSSSRHAGGAQGHERGRVDNRERPRVDDMQHRAHYEEQRYGRNYYNNEVERYDYARAIRRPYDQHLASASSRNHQHQARPPVAAAAAGQHGNEDSSPKLPSTPYPVPSPPEDEKNLTQSAKRRSEVAALKIPKDVAFGHDVRAIIKGNPEPKQSNPRSAEVRMETSGAARDGRLFGPELYHGSGFEEGYASDQDGYGHRDHQYMRGQGRPAEDYGSRGGRRLFGFVVNSQHAERRDSGRVPGPYDDRAYGCERYDEHGRTYATESYRQHSHQVYGDPRYGYDDRRHSQTYMQPLRQEYAQFSNYGHMPPPRHANGPAPRDYGHGGYGMRPDARNDKQGGYHPPTQPSHGDEYRPDEMFLQSAQRKKAKNRPSDAKHASEGRKKRTLRPQASAPNYVDKLPSPTPTPSSLRNSDEGDAEEEEEKEDSSTPARPPSPKIWADKEGVQHWKPKVLPKPKLKVPVAQQLIEKTPPKKTSAKYGDAAVEKSSAEKVLVERSIEDDGPMPQVVEDYPPVQQSPEDSFPVQNRPRRRELTPDYVQEDRMQRRYAEDRYRPQQRGEERGYYVQSTVQSHCPAPRTSVPQFTRQDYDNLQYSREARQTQRFAASHRPAEQYPEEQPSLRYYSGQRPLPKQRLMHMPPAERPTSPAYLGHQERLHEDPARRASAGHTSSQKTKPAPPNEFGGMRFIFDRRGHIRSMVPVKEPKPKELTPEPIDPKYYFDSYGHVSGRYDAARVKRRRQPWEPKRKKGANAAAEQAKETGEVRESAKVAGGTEREAAMTRTPVGKLQEGHTVRRNFEHDNRHAPTDDLEKARSSESNGLFCTAPPEPRSLSRLAPSPSTSFQRSSSERHGRPFVLSDGLEEDPFQDTAKLVPQSQLYKLSSGTRHGHIVEETPEISEEAVLLSVEQSGGHHRLPRSALLASVRGLDEHTSPRPPKPTSPTKRPRSSHSSSPFSTGSHDDDLLLQEPRQQQKKIKLSSPPPPIAKPTTAANLRLLLPGYDSEEDDDVEMAETALNEPSFFDQFLAGEDHAALDLPAHGGQQLPGAQQSLTPEAVGEWEDAVAQRSESPLFYEEESVQDGDTGRGAGADDIADGYRFQRDVDMGEEDHDEDEESSWFS